MVIMVVWSYGHDRHRYGHNNGLQFIIHYIATHYWADDHRVGTILTRVMPIPQVGETGWKQHLIIDEDLFPGERWNLEGIISGEVRGPLGLG